MIARLVRMTLFFVLAFSAVAETTLTVPTKHELGPIRIAYKYTWKAENFRHFTYLDSKGNDLKLTNPVTGKITKGQWKKLNQKNNKIAAVVIPGSLVKTTSVRLSNESLASKCKELGVTTSACRSAARHNRIRTNRRIKSAEVRILTSLLPKKTDTQAPSVPTGVAVAASSTTTAKLEWKPSTDNVGVVGYRIFKSGTQVAEAKGTNYEITGLSANVEYEYSVAAFDAAGNISGQSKRVLVKTKAEDWPLGMLSLACLIALLAILALGKVILDLHGGLPYKKPIGTLLETFRQGGTRSARLLWAKRPRFRRPKLFPKPWTAVRLLKNIKFLSRRDPEPLPVAALSSTQAETLSKLSNEFLVNLAHILGQDDDWQKYFDAQVEPDPKLGHVMVGVCSKSNGFPNLNAHLRNVEQAEENFCKANPAVAIEHSDYSRIARQGLRLMLKHGVKFRIRLEFDDFGGKQ